MSTLAPGTSAVSKKYLDKLISESAPSEQEAEAAREFSDQLYRSINKGGVPVETWRSVDLGHLRFATDEFDIYRQELRAAADQYLTQFQWIHHPHLDWLVANTLMYAEVSATALAFNPLPIADLTGIRWRRVAVNVTIGAILWAIWFAILIGTLMLSDGFGWPSGIWLGLTAVYKFNRAKQLRKRRRVLELMFNAYDAAKTSTLSYSVLWDLLSKSRDQGVYWDPELYHLVDSRRKP